MFFDCSDVNFNIQLVIFGNSVIIENKFYDRKEKSLTKNSFSKISYIHL